jgi:hypothetical protein
VVIIERPAAHDGRVVRRALWAPDGITAGIARGVTARPDVSGRVTARARGTSAAVTGMVVVFGLVRVVVPRVVAGVPSCGGVVPCAATATATGGARARGVVARLRVELWIGHHIAVAWVVDGVEAGGLAGCGAGVG